MGLAVAAEGHPRSSRRLFLAGSILVFTAVAAAGFTIWNLREDAIESYRQEMGNLGLILSAEMARSVEEVDLILREVQAKAEGAADSPATFHDALGTEAVHDFLLDRARNLPQISAIFLVDAKGLGVNNSRLWPPPYVDLHDRGYYQHFRDNADPGLFVSEALRSRVTNLSTVFLARRIHDSRGQFLGVAVAAMDVRYIEDFYRAIALKPGISVNLVRRDGTFLVHYPDANVEGQRIPSGSPWYALAEKGGSYRSPGYFDGIPRIVSIHPLRGYPLSVDVAVKEPVVLAQWQRQSTWIALGALCAVLGVATLFRIVFLQFRRLESQAEEMMRTAVALRHSERRFRDFATSSSDWLWEQDAGLRFTWSSHQASRPDLVHEYIGRTRWEVAGADLAEEKWAAHKGDLLAHRPFRDFRFAIASGDKFLHMSISGNPVFDAYGVFQGYRGTGRDITAQVQAAEELSHAKELADRAREVAESASRAKSEFLANMSHELRTPLNAIIGFAEIIRDKLFGEIEARYVEYAADIARSGRYLLDLISDLLDMSKIEAGRYKLDEEQVGLAAVVQDCIAMIRPRAEEGKVRLECPASSSKIVLAADARAVKQILINLLSNAVKFTPPGGVVSVTAELAAHGGLDLCVIDTGIGIEGAALKDLVEPFRQADASVARRYGGTGLGLAICNRLMQLHGGSLTIKSRPGLGTTVCAIFPRARVAAAPGAGSQAVWESDQ